MAETVSLTHHEKWDGTGYPHTLKGKDIPLVGRIVALANVFDALTHERPLADAFLFCSWRKVRSRADKFHFTDGVKQ